MISQKKCLPDRLISYTRQKNSGHLLHVIFHYFSFLLLNFLFDYISWLSWLPISFWSCVKKFLFWSGFRNLDPDNRHGSPPKYNQLVLGPYPTSPKKNSWKSICNFSMHTHVQHIISCTPAKNVADNFMYVSEHPFAPWTATARNPLMNWFKSHI